MPSITDDCFSHIYSAIDATTHKVQAHRFNFLCICGKLARIIRRQQIDQVEFGPYRVCRCVNNRQVTVLRVAMCFKYRSQRLLPGDLTWCAARYGRFCVRQRHAVHQRQQICLFSCLDFSFYLLLSLRIAPLRFRAGCRNRRLNLGYNLSLFILCFSFCLMICICRFSGYIFSFVLA